MVFLSIGMRHSIHLRFVLFNILWVYRTKRTFFSAPITNFSSRVPFHTPPVSIQLMNDVPHFLLFIVWSVKLAMEMILMVLQWHSNTQRGITQISHAFGSMFCFLRSISLLTLVCVAICFPFILLSVLFSPLSLSRVTISSFYISSL